MKFLEHPITICLCYGCIIALFVWVTVGITGACQDPITPKPPVIEVLACTVIKNGAMSEFRKSVHSDTCNFALNGTPYVLETRVVADCKTAEKDGYRPDPYYQCCRVCR